MLPGGTALAVFEPPATEFIGLAFAVVVLILAFGSVLAMGLPIAVALGGVGAGMGLIAILSNVFNIPDFTTFLGAMIGLGVGIDYALFIVTRYREGLHAGRSPREATITAMDTAGRAVIFAGVTVVVSLLGLLLIGIGWVGGLGIGVAVTVLVTMITSITLLPALLGFARERVEVTRWRGLIVAGFVAVALLGIGIGVPALSAVGAGLAAVTLLVSFAVRPLRQTVPHRVSKPVRETLAYRWSRTIQRRPWLGVVAGTVFLLALAPVLGLRLGTSDEGNLAEDTYTRQAYDVLAEGFGPGFNGPFMITVVPGAGDSVTAVDTLQQALAETPGVATVTPAFPTVRPPRRLPHQPRPDDRWDAATTELVTTLRDDVIPAAIAGTSLDVKVTGTTAANIDFTDFLAQRTFVFFAAVLVVVPAPDDGLPLAPRAAQGRRDERAVDRRHLRRARRDLPVGLGRRPHRHRQGSDRGDVAADAVRHRVRTLDGLRGLPALPGPRGTTRPATPPPPSPTASPRRLGSSRPPPPSWWSCSDRSCSRTTGPANCSASAWRSPSCSTPPSSACCSCRPRWSSSATRTGGCPGGSTGSSPGSTSTAAHDPAPAPVIDEARSSNRSWSTPEAAIEVRPERAHRGALRSHFARVAGPRRRLATATAV